MYHRILVALENGPADETLVPHITELARRLGSDLLLVHVADGWAARNIRPHGWFMFNAYLKVSGIGPM